MNSYKKDFPIFKRKINGKAITYLDSASTTQKSEEVINAITNHLRSNNANIHRGIYSLSEEATLIYEGVRRKIAHFINSESFKEVIFTNGTTIGINIVAFGLSKRIKKDDSILISEIEHHSNIVPWQVLAAKTGAHLYFLTVDENGRFTKKVKDQNDQLAFEDYLDIPNLKITSLSYISNVLGTINPVKEVFKRIKKHSKDCVFIIDAAQSAPHIKVDVQDLDCDFLVFSSHKIFGPTGIGVLYGKQSSLEDLDPYIVGSQMISEVTKEKATWTSIPNRFEPGTMPIEAVVGLGAAISYIEKIGMDTIEEQEGNLTSKMLSELKKIDKLTLLGPKDLKNRIGVFSFTLKGVHPHDVAQILSDEGICVRSGHHCAMPLHQRFGISATTRASLSIYNDEKDIEKLIVGIKKVKKIFKI